MVNLLAQADTIVALEHFVLAVIREIGGGMFLVAYGLGFVSFPLAMKGLRWLGVRIMNKEGK